MGQKLLPAQAVPQPPSKSFGAGSPPPTFFSDHCTRRQLVDVPSNCLVLSPVTCCHKLSLILNRSHASDGESPEVLSKLFW